MTLASGYARQQKFDRATVLYQELAGLDFGYRDWAYLQLAEIAEKVGRAAGALQWYKRIDGSGLTNDAFGRVRERIRYLERRGQ